MNVNQDPLEAASAIMGESDEVIELDPGLDMAALWIALDIARSLRNIRWALERMSNQG